MHAGRTLRKVAPLLAPLWLVLAARAASSEPFDPSDPTPRGVLVQLENSSDLATVGQSFGAGVTASYTASGGTGTIVIPPASHAALRGVASAGAYVIYIDLATGAATSQPTSGGSPVGPGQLALFSQQALGTATLAGFMDGSPTPLFCTSQADVVAACQANPIPEICNATCVLVPGASYDPVTGEINLVGGEQRQICGGTGCSGTHIAFAHAGDLRFSEGPGVPALPWPALVLLGLSLVAGSAARLRRRAP
jgi:hypothetical protein